MMAILWQNLNFTELLTILQFITIPNSFDGFTSWQQYQNMSNKKASYINSVFDFLILDFRKFRSFCLQPPMALTILHCGTWLKMVVHHCSTTFCCLFIKALLCKQQVQSHPFRWFEPTIFWLQTKHRADEATMLATYITDNNNNFRVWNIRVSDRTLIYNVCPEAALTWPSRHSRHRHLCRFYRSLINR